MRFRIAEQQIPDDNKNRFFIEKGTDYHITGFFGFKQRHTAWTPVIGLDNNPLAYKEMDEAVTVVIELKKQIPTYHEIT